MNEPDPQDCLGSTLFIDSDTDVIRGYVNKMNLSGCSETKRAVALYDYVRDSIAYDFAAPTDPSAYRASSILENGRGHCVRKAVLLCALARAAGVPSALVFADLRDRTLSESVIQLMGTDVLHHHGLVAFHLGGEWRKADPTTPRETAARKGYRLVEFEGASDALGHAKTAEGKPHLEYLTFHGMHPDLPFVDIMRSLAENYANADSEKFNGLGLSTSDDFAKAADAYSRA